MKICAAQTRPAKGDIQQNLDNHRRLIDLALADYVDAIIFPELSLTGYEPSLAKTLATHPNDGRFDVFQTISDARQITIGVGMPLHVAAGICIGMLLFQPQRARQMYAKQYLHPDELPFFVSGEGFPAFTLHGVRVAPAICYELSIPAHAARAVRHEADVYVASVAKSAAGVDQADRRLADIAAGQALTVMMANCIGPSEDFDSAGQTAVWRKDGTLAGRLDDTREGVLIYDLGVGQATQKYLP